MCPPSPGSRHNWSFGGGYAPFGSLRRKKKACVNEAQENGKKIIPLFVKTEVTDIFNSACKSFKRPF